MSRHVVVVVGYQAVPVAALVHRLAPGRVRAAWAEDWELGKLAEAAVIAGLAVWSLELGGRPASIVLLAVAATAGSILSMASKDRVAALRIPPAPERRIGFLLGGRDARLLFIAIGAVIGMPEAALAAVAITSGSASPLDC